MGEDRSTLPTMAARNVVIGERDAARAEAEALRALVVEVLAGGLVTDLKPWVERAIKALGRTT